MTRIEFHCGRCRLRGSLEASAFDPADLTTIEQFVVESHREISPDCEATDTSIQILAISHPERIAS